MYAAESLTRKFSTYLNECMESKDLLGVCPRCEFRIDMTADTISLKVSFLREGWHYEAGDPKECAKNLLDLAVKVAENLEKWIIDRIYTEEATIRYRKLSQYDALLVGNALINPPDPNEKLKKLFEDEMVGI